MFKLALRQSEGLIGSVMRLLAIGLPIPDHSIGRYKRLIGDALRSREDACRLCEVKIAVKVLNRMLELGRPICVRVA